MAIKSKETVERSIDRMTSSNHSCKLQSKFTRDCREQSGAKAGHLVLVRSRAHDEVSQVKLQVRQADQVWFHRQLQVSSLGGDLQWRSCPPVNKRKGKKTQSERIPVTSKGTHTLIEMRADVNAVPHAGPGYHFLGTRTNSRLKAIAFRLDIITKPLGVNA